MNSPDKLKYSCLTHFAHVIAIFKNCILEVVVDFLCLINVNVTFNIKKFYRQEVCKVFNILQKEIVLLQNQFAEFFF